MSLLSGFAVSVLAVARWLDVIAGGNPKGPDCTESGRITLCFCMLEGSIIKIK